MKDKAKLEGSLSDTVAMSKNDGAEIKDPEEVDWLGLARANYRASTDFLDKEYRTQFDKNLSNFRSKHPVGSKYNTDTYKFRSRLFRPKTRTAVRKNEASLAAAIFSATDTVVLEAEDSDDPQKRVDAVYWNEVVNYRLDKTIPWFKTVIGAFQEASIYGIIVSKQYWEYEEYVVGEVPVEDPMDTTKPMKDNEGNVMMRPEMDVKKDRPVVKLIEIENIRFAPNCDWTDPINSSPYLVECIPMYLSDVRAKMTDTDEETGEPDWKYYSDSAMLASSADLDMDGGKSKKKKKDDSDDNEVVEFAIVWVLEHTVRYQGQDLIYYTLGTSKQLTEPEPLQSVYMHGIRPYVLGNTIIEAHKSIPDSAVQLSDPLQAEANDVVNQRRDNVKIVLNQRKIVDRNSNTDLHALSRSVPGGVVLTDDPGGVQPESVRDVTGSAYSEQDRVDTDFDDISGVFNTGSVANNRALGETVGGMELMNASATKNEEYVIRTFVETWMEPVLRQLVNLEQHYEDDDHIKEIATKAMKKSEKKRAEKMSAPAEGAPPVEGAPPAPVEGAPPAPVEGEVPAEELEAYEPLPEPQKIDLRVNVGFGNLNPDQRVKKIVSGLKMMGEVAPWAMENLDVETVSDRIFGALGHKNGHKFFTSFEKPEPQGDPEADLRAKELQLKEMELASNEKFKGIELQLKAQIEEQKLINDRELGMAKIAAEQDITVKKLYTQLGIEGEKRMNEREKINVDKAVRSATNITKLADVQNKYNELEFKKETGRPGI